jgi:hypothetical protein
MYFNLLQYSDLFGFNSLKCFYMHLRCSKGFHFVTKIFVLILKLLYLCFSNFNLLVIMFHCAGCFRVGTCSVVFQIP